MILCIDAGNSRLKWGLWAAQRPEAGAPAIWRGRGALPYHASLVSALQQQLPALPQRLLACNVAGPAVAADIEALAAALTVPLTWFRSSAAAAGVSNGYANPTQLGADRWAALIGARARHSGPALVVMAGTATTIDVLDAAGVFHGGLILPGLDLMRRALAQNTAALPAARGCFCAVPTTTDDAIMSGCLAATLGAIERMAQQMTRPLGGTVAATMTCDPMAAACPDFVCLLSGGAADHLAVHLDLPLQRIDNLVLDGLACVAAMDAMIHSATPVGRADLL